MKPLKDKEVLPELKRRIRASLVGIVESECKSDGCIFNGGHSIHFTIKNGDYLLTGTAMKRV